MRFYRLERKIGGGYSLQVPYRGVNLLRQPLYTKGTAFTHEERRSFDLEGLLPNAVSTLEQQSYRFNRNLRNKQTDLEKYIGLAALHDRNEHLFFRVVLDNLEEYLPIVYTPTVGLACQEFSHIFRRARGIWITPTHRGRIERVLASAPFSDVRLIVVTDNERILGLGDQGAGGMGIPVGKLALYTVAAGIHPAQTLPVSLDVGTDNADLLKDDLYLGWRHARLRGAEYETLVEEFVAAVKKCFPGALLQWEDFKKGTAFSLLERYREALPSFNDDIQGTAAVTMAAVNAAARISGIPLKEQRVVILGGGAAGIGIARLLDDTLERAGLTRIERRAACAILDSHGLLCDDVEIADIYKRDFAWPAELAARFDLGPGRPRDLASVIRTFHPHVLIGTSGQPGIFSEALVRDMAAHVERPVILPLSNPTSKTEAAPADLIAWTDGRALIATGSPFPPVTLHGKTHRIGQANNVFIFPGVGLGSLVAETSIVPEAFFAAAAEQLAHEISEADLADGVLLPRVRDLRRITAHVAEAVVRTACSLGIARPIEPSAIPLAVREAMWEPAYPHLEPI